MGHWQVVVYVAVVFIGALAFLALVVHDLEARERHLETHRRIEAERRARQEHIMEVAAAAEVEKASA